MEEIKTLWGALLFNDPKFQKSIDEVSDKNYSRIPLDIPSTSICVKLWSKDLYVEGDFNKFNCDKEISYLGIFKNQFGNEIKDLITCSSLLYPRIIHENDSICFGLVLDDFYTIDGFRLKYHFEIPKYIDIDSIISFTENMGILPEQCSNVNDRHVDIFEIRKQLICLINGTTITNFNLSFSNMKVLLFICYQSGFFISNEIIYDGKGNGGIIIENIFNDLIYGCG